MHKQINQNGITNNKLIIHDRLPDIDSKKLRTSVKQVLRDNLQAKNGKV